MLLWFAFPWLTFEVLVHDPGTHIYTYLLPASVLVAFGVEVVAEGLERLLGEKYGSRVTAACLALFFLFFFALDHFIYIDHTPEYPWEQCRFLLWTLGQPETEYKLWTYGFPYNRKWEQIGEFIRASEYTEYCFSNEKHSIAVLYVPCTYLSTFTTSWNLVILTGYPYMGIEPRNPLMPAYVAVF